MLRIALLVAAVAAVAAAADWRSSPDAVPSLPGIGAMNSSTYSGHILSNATYGVELYYFFSGSQTGQVTDDVIIWLQGGPGCSSLFGFFIENGEFTFDYRGNININPFAWNANAHMLYWDQPAGTGWSTVNSSKGHPRTEAEVAADLYTGVLGFFQLHPEYNQSRLFIFGESYGGKYAPGLAYYWLTQASHPAWMPKLSGCALGDGWTDPWYQVASYPDFAQNRSLVPAEQIEKMRTMVDKYHSLILAGHWLAATTLDNAILNAILHYPPTYDPYSDKYRLGHDPTNVPSAHMTTWLNSDAVKEALHVSGRFLSCDASGGASLNYDEDKTMNWTIPVILESIPVLLYNGNDDITCNAIGTSYWSHALQWSGASAFASATNTSWVVDGYNAGYYKTAQQLTLLVLWNSGHMVPFYQPKNSLSMLNSWINGELTGN